jgi:crotonobetainyl-CoA:carnitine CoA-transferase CaiB-like acyl-CoA transferase
LACVATALLAAATFVEGRTSVAPGRVSLDREHVAAAVSSERWFRRADGPPAGTGFAPLSRFWRTADGWVRTHANYPWHRAALLAALGLVSDDGAEAGGDPGGAGDATVAAVARALADRRSEDVEDAVFAAGGIAAAVRTREAWQAHPQGRAVGSEPLIAHRRIGDAPPRSGRSQPRHSGAAGSAGALPARGVRVLDLTRVIAGPVCTRFLGALGADVVRLDPPHRPDLSAARPADTLLGKRSAIVDLETRDGATTFHDLLGGADVVVCGYRPGALDRFGLSEEALAERHPGIVVVLLDAWGHTGPWAGRRGFDSVVQAPTGIALLESGELARGEGGLEPGALPCQLLDHGTGYLAAAAALDGLLRQTAEGGTHVRRLSLARTAGWLTATGVTADDSQDATGRSHEHHVGSRRPGWLVELDSPDGPVLAVGAPGVIGGRSLAWPSPVTGYGSDPPRWVTEPH